MPTLTLKFQLGKSPIWEAALGKIQHLGKGPHKDRIWSMTDLVNQDKVAPDLKGLFTYLGNFMVSYLA